MKKITIEDLKKAVEMLDESKREMALSSISVCYQFEPMELKPQEIPSMVNKYLDAYKQSNFETQQGLTSDFYKKRAENAKKMREKGLLPLYLSFAPIYPITNVKDYYSNVIPMLQLEKEQHGFRFSEDQQAVLDKMIYLAKNEAPLADYLLEADEFVLSFSKNP